MTLNINIITPYISLVPTCPRFVDDVIANDVRTISEAGGHSAPELSHTVPQAIGVVIETLVGNTNSLCSLVRTPLMFGTVLFEIFIHTTVSALSPSFLIFPPPFLSHLTVLK